MKIAIATDNDQVSAHFGHCACYTLFEVEDSGTGKKILSRTCIDTPEHQPGMLPGFLHQTGANIVIAGGMGARAQQLLMALNIQPYIGVTGKVDDVIHDFLAGNLQMGESLCDHGHVDGNHHHDCQHH
jgi:predicted Fe-Mo cluster-binding NifX family protein